MSKAEIDAHLAKFDNIMVESKGNLRIVEQKLGLEKGYLSNSDTIAVFFIYGSLSQN